MNEQKKFTFASEEHLKLSVINAIIKNIMFPQEVYELKKNILGTYNIKYIYTNNLVINILYVDRFNNKGQLRLITL